MVLRGNSSVRPITVLAVLSLFAVVASATEDHVTKFKNKEVVVGRVKKADLNGIDIEIIDPRTKAVANVAVQASEVADIDWDVSDQDFRGGMSAFDGGAYGQAAQRFHGTYNEPDSIGRAEVKPALFYYYAESLYRSGKPGEAVPVFEKLVNEFKTSYYVPMAMGSLVDAAIQTKDFAKVPPLLNTLRALGGEQKALADYYEGQMMLAQGKVKEAEGRFASAASGSNAPSAKGMALMGQAKCAIAANDVTKARDLAKRALDAGPPANVAGAAHLVIGDALLAEVDAQKPTGEALEKKLMDALLEYMRVLEQYRGFADSEAQAMLRGGDCLVRLFKSNPNARGADRHRAVYLYTKLTSDAKYRNTRWAVEAAENMKNLR
jgi:hypothetical protein